MVMGVPDIVEEEIRESRGWRRWVVVGGLKEKEGRRKKTVKESSLEIFDEESRMSSLSSSPSARPVEISLSLSLTHVIPPDLLLRNSISAWRGDERTPLFLLGGLASFRFRPDKNHTPLFGSLFPPEEAEHSSTTQRGGELSPRASIFLYLAHRIFNEWKKKKEKKKKSRRDRISILSPANSRVSV